MNLCGSRSHWNYGWIMNYLIYWYNILNAQQEYDAPFQEIWPPVLEDFLKEMNVVLPTEKKSQIKI